MTDNPLPTTDGGFQTVLADPPWQFDNRTGKVAPEHRRLHRYTTMTTDEICAIPVADVAATPGHLYLWCPMAFMPDGLRVMVAWGYVYKTGLVWAKRRKDGGPDGRGVGFYFRLTTELVLFGVRGSMRTLAPARRRVNIIETRKREHSRKPDELYPIIEECSPGPRPDDSAMRESEDALQIAERSGDDFALAYARLTLGLALVHRHTNAERDRGHKLLAEVSDVFRRRGRSLGELPIVNVYLARERARRGDRDGAIPLMRAAADDLVREGQLLAWGIPATGVLVETLLDRGAEGDVVEAEAAIERLAAAPTDDDLPVRDIWLLRLRALLAGAHGDAATYAYLRDRYRDTATMLGFEGHIAWAEAMP